MNRPVILFVVSYRGTSQGSGGNGCGTRNIPFPLTGRLPTRAPSRRTTVMTSHRRRRRTVAVVLLHRCHAAPGTRDSGRTNSRARRRRIPGKRLIRRAPGRWLPRPQAEPLDSWAPEDPQLAWAAVPPEDETRDSSVPVDPQEAEQAWPPSAQADEAQEPWAEENYRPASPTDDPVPDEPPERPVAGDRQQAWSDGTSPSDGGQDPWAYPDPRDYRPPETPQEAEPREPWDYGDRETPGRPRLQGREVPGNRGTTGTGRLLAGRGWRAEKFRGAVGLRRPGGSPADRDSGAGGGPGAMDLRQC